MISNIRQSICSILLWALPCTLVHAQAPDYATMLRDALLMGERERAQDIALSWHQSGVLPANLLHWNYNLLMSVEPNAILVIPGGKLALPAYVLQSVHHKREDVALVNLELWNTPGYHSELLNTGSTRHSNPDQVPGLLEALARHYPQRPLYLSIQCDELLLRQLSPKLYLTGLAFRWSNTPLDNLPMLVKHFESDFLLDYLKVPFNGSDNQTLNALQTNYLPGLNLLFKHYTQSQQTDKAVAVDSLYHQLLRNTGTEKKYAALQSVNGLPAKFKSNLSAKKIEKGFKQVTADLFAAETETTIGQYEGFLEDLLKNRMFEEIQFCAFPKTVWQTLLTDATQKVRESELFENAHPDAPECPVQNISYEAAQLYCEWLTRVYNASTEKKRFAKVVFRLPSQAEWEQAAGATLSKPDYPWGKYFRNSKGCYLGNFDSKIPCEGCDLKSKANDGGFFPVKADSYFPNAIGLYCISGNVAEMVQERGIAKGGSWEDLPENCTITSQKHYESPSPAIGFRVFMQVIQQ